MIRAGLIGLLVAGSLLLLGQTRSTARCAVEPIALDKLNTAIARPVVPFPENRPVTGERVDHEPVADDLLELLVQLDACAHAGEPLRVWSHYAPDYLARLFRINGPFDAATFAAYATPRPGGTGRGARIASVDAIWKVQDGLYAVEAVKTYPSIPMPKRLIFWITVQGRNYLIQEITGEISFSLP